MTRDQTTDYVSAFVVGTLVGVGAALLLKPKPATRREKIMKELKPYRKKLEKRTARARKKVGEGTSAAADLRDDLMEASRSLIQDMRSEVADMVKEARKEITAAVEGQVESAQHALKKSAKRVRS